MIINAYYAFIGAYKFVKFGLATCSNDSIELFINRAKLHANFDDRYSPTENIYEWFEWEAIIKNLTQKYVCPVKCDKTVTLEQGLECLRIFLRDRYLSEKKDMPLKTAFEELRSIIDPEAILAEQEAILAEQFKKSLKPLDLIKKGWECFLSAFKKYTPVAEVQPKYYNANFETSEIWQVWLVCVDKVKDFNIQFQYNKKKISQKQCFMACYEYVKMDSHCSDFDAKKPGEYWKVSDLLDDTDMVHGSIYYPTQDLGCWYNWMECVQLVVNKYNVQFSSDPKQGLSLEQGLEAMRIFIEKNYYRKNHKVSLLVAFKEMDEQINNNLESSDMWKSWLSCFNEAKNFDKVFYKPYDPNIK